MKILKKWVYKPVLVEWLDHVGHGPTWTDVKDVDHNAAVFTSVGYLLSINPTTITIASTLDDKRTETGDTTVLVRSCITKMQELHL